MSNDENDTNLHAHVSTSSRDCDGGHGYDYIMGFSEAEIAERVEADGVNDFSEIHFMGRVMVAVACPYAVDHEMTVTVDKRGIQVHEQTDEGYRSADVRWCRDESCDPNAPTMVYDEFAEAMGY